MIWVGFSGTRNGMTEAQKTQTAILLKSLGPQELRHGDCIGADAEIHEIALIQGITVGIHPPIDDSKRAYCKNARVVLEPKSYLARNRDIVLDTDLLIAAPPSCVETQVGGTWYTVRYARRIGKPIYIVWPDGVVRTENI